MTPIYVPPPDINEIVATVATWIAALCRCKVTVTLDYLNGESHTVETIDPNRAHGSPHTTHSHRQEDVTP